MPAVGGDDEVGANRDGPGLRHHLHADHAPRHLEEPGDLGLHTQAEPRISGRRRGEEIEEVPLRHEDEEPAPGREMGEVGDRHDHLTDLRRQLAHFLVREPQETFQQAELVHDLECRRVDRVAAEVAQEVSVLLEHQDCEPGAGQQQAEHHAGRPTSGDAALDRGRGACHGWPTPIMPHPWSAASDR